MKEGWIKLHRKVLDSDMYRTLTSKQRDVLVVCLILANHETKSWVWEGKQVKVKAGSFITSLESLQKFLGSDVTLQNLRTSLKLLEKWEFLTSKSTNAGRLITICKYEHYQHEDKATNKQTNRQLTSNQQTANRQLTTTNNIKNVKNYKEEKKDDSKESFEDPNEIYRKGYKIL